VNYEIVEMEPYSGGKTRDDEKLSKEANRMIIYADDILKRIDDGDLYWSEDKTEIEGNLKNYDNE